MVFGNSLVVPTYYAFFTTFSVGSVAWVYREFGESDATMTCRRAETLTVHVPWCRLPHLAPANRPISGRRHLDSLWGGASAVWSSPRGT